MATLTFLVVLAVLSQAWSDGATDQLSQAVNSFSQSLYQQIGRGDGSLVYSPYSIHSALTMTSLGARADTLDEMMTSLGTSAVSDPHSAYMNEISELNSVPNVTLSVANALFMNPSIALKSEFVEAVTTNYHAKADNFDLNAEGGPEQEINDYVAENTNDVIQDLLPANSIKPETLVILINTVFFNGTWDQRFNEYMTHKEDFFKADGSVTQVDMMEHTRPITVDLLHDDVNKLDMIDLPFQGRRFSLFIVVPRDNEAMTQLESDPANMLRASDQQAHLLTTHAVRVVIPEFKIETEERLVPHLKAMGMRKAFNRGQADFSDMSETPAFISEVIHKAVIDVTETGTVAAAATAIHMMTMSMPFENDQFIANRPFLFFLKDKTTNQILFQGKFTGQ